MLTSLLPLVEEVSYMKTQLSFDLCVKNVFERIFNMYYLNHK